jgi:hypothetical protein
LAGAAGAVFAEIGPDFFLFRRQSPWVVGEFKTGQRIESEGIVRTAELPSFVVQDIEAF